MGRGAERSWMGTYLITLRTLEETENFGLALGREARPGDVLCLDGDLGAGKTALTQAIARGLEVPADCYVTSPSFAIMHEYPGRLPLYHMDFYRLGDSSEVEELGFEEYFYLAGLTVIEWSRRAEEILPVSRLQLDIALIEDDRRRVTLSFADEQWHTRIRRIFREAGLSYSEQEP